MKAVIFDMDGVLIDSEPLYMQFVLDFYHQFHQNLEYQTVCKLAGSSSKESWRLMGEWWCPKKSPKEMELFYKENVSHDDVDFTQIINPYVTYILPKLKAAGFKLAIASSSPYEDIYQMCCTCHIKEYFDVILSGDDFENSKPDPEIYISAMNQLGVDKQNCIIIEDSDYGIEAGKKAGAFVIAKKDVRFGFTQAKADLQVHDLLEAYRYIMKGCD